MLVKIIFLSLVISFLSNSVLAEDSIDKAFKLCAVFDGTGLLSEKCKVSGSNFSVDVSIDTSSKEAIQICKQIVGMLAKDKVYFDDGDWKIRIYSPFSNGKTIANCNLPS
ncbi:hypothetical protein NP603_08405 [Methylomonas sp. SURF-1]|uniref:Uncharacterized protein n=1 Tax=Methylomonas aurea TaxID=2952224 RepID=A0ABT1UFY2_9GAMM|nr:hypothetical protein [Methylomonas sp. SURF-1]MCQ8181127.1 hypothetical protein [Methylomonas sp. SURF-1]